VLAALVVFGTSIGFTAFDATTAESVSFRVAKLRGAVVEMGTLSSWDFRDKAYGVRLRATLCFEPRARSVESYPLEFQIAHYSLEGSQASAWGEPFRTVEDSANWIVPFGEVGFRNGCRDVVVEDILVPPSSRSTTDALRVTVVFETKPPVERQASGRTVVKCGSFGPS